MCTFQIRLWTVETFSEFSTSVLSSAQPFRSYTAEYAFGKPAGFVSQLFIT